MTAAAGWLLAAAVAVGAAEGESAFRAVPLVIGPGPRRLLVRDVDGDGRLDLVAVHPDSLVVHRQGKEAFEPVAPPVSFPASGGLFDVGDVDGDGRDDLVHLDAAGRVRAHPGREDGSFGEARLLLEEVPAAVPVETEDAPLLLDLDGDGDLDLALPGASSVLLFRREPGGAYAAAGSVAARVEIDAAVGDRREARSRDLTEAFRSRWRIPLFELEDANGDGRLDLLAEGDEAFSVYLAGEDGSFPASPSFRLDLEALRRRLPRLPGDRSFDPENLAAAISNRVEDRRADLDGDGRTDFVVRAGDTITVFAGGEGGVRFGEPVQVLKASGNLLAIFLFDDDADGRPDLGILRMEDVSLAEALSWFVLPVRVRFEVFLYRNRGGCSFSRRPDRRQAFLVALPTVRGVEAEAERLFDEAGEEPAVLAGDFDGDGEEDDLLVAAKDGTVRIDAGVGEGVGFEGRDPVLWILESLGWRSGKDEIVVTLETIADLRSGRARRALERLEGRAADWSVAVPVEGEPGEAPEVWVLDLDGDGRDDAIVGWEVPSGAEGGRFRATAILSGPARD